MERHIVTIVFGVLVAVTAVFGIFGKGGILEMTSGHAETESAGQQGRAASAAPPILARYR
jgi:hypothetical protein